MRAKCVNEVFSKDGNVKRSLRIGEAGKYAQIWDDLTRDEDGDPGFDIKYEVLDNDYDPRFNPKILEKIHELMSNGELIEKKITSPNENPDWEESVALYKTEKGPIFHVPFDYGYTFGTTIKEYPEMWKYLTADLDPAEVDSWDDEDEED